MDSTSSTPLRPRLQRLLALALCVLGPAWLGCAQPVSQPCSPTLICPPGYACTGDNLDCFKCADPDDCTTETGAGCGNQRIDEGEACDDGNLRSGDGCNAECTSNETCGNRFRDLVVDGGEPEVCDDGNQVDGDGCSKDCRSNEVCGNGITDVREQCDDNGVSTDLCRTDCVLKRCGNGSAAPAHIEEFYWSDGGLRERCDDGNATGGDGCSADCLVVESCGNGEKDFGFEADGGEREQCDDRNLADGDGCSSFCKLEVCGNGVLDRALVDGGFEVCDDGNTADGDGCSADCRSDETCGNGTTDRVLKDGGYEQCDDGNTQPGDGCGPICWWEQCGNGYLDAVYSDGGFRGYEQCDDGNLDAGDGCGPMCWREECGNGFVDWVYSDGGFNWDGGLPVEQCDDGNLDGGDGCGPACWREECGNGYLDSISSVGGYQGYEQCDDGNTQDGDFCSALCWIPTCGNGYLDTANSRGANPDGGLLGREQCDDGNLVAGDGCSAFCQFEGCGNGLVDRLPDGGMEDCDDGNRDPGDKCGPDCRWEECGNGILDSLYSDGGFGGFEQCDDGNTLPGDGCGATCWREECGNGIPDLVYSDGGFRGYEQCDDGNKLPGDNCGPTCWREECGNGILDDVKSSGAHQQKEQCDDGNLVTGDGCGASCWWEECGNGILDVIYSDGGYNRDGGVPFEQCDDGNRDAGDTCGATCWREECGNTIVDRVGSDGGFQGVEQCDDGDTLAGDKCGASCWWEECGNGILDVIYSDGGFRGVEQCDDGDRDAGDGCGPMCWREECGNGFLDLLSSDGGFRGREQCDRGDRDAGDGCGPMCWLEECGNGYVDTYLVNIDGGLYPAEECDDENSAAGDSCGFRTVTEGNITRTVTSCRSEVCGNAVVDPGEECDDGPAWDSRRIRLEDGGFFGPFGGDGCSSDCRLEACGNGYVDAVLLDGGYEDCDLGPTQTNTASCNQANAVSAAGISVGCKTPVCGDGYRNANALTSQILDGGVTQFVAEQCDDGNADDTDGCLTNCQTAQCGDGKLREGVEECDDGNRDDTDSCRNDCQWNRCGDGKELKTVTTPNGNTNPLRPTAEECDDGDLQKGDGCSEICRLELCGNGVTDSILVDGGIEECDDGNQVAGDGCSNRCWLEACGNGITDNVILLDGGREDCDLGGLPNTATCNQANAVNAADGGAVGCRTPRCGDGYWNPEARTIPVVVGGVVTYEPEECDDGNANENDSCLNNCRLARCGDGILNADSEECDDGVTLLPNGEPDPAGNNDSCRNDCKWNVCGDGWLWTSVSTVNGNVNPRPDQVAEECDDNNLFNADGCSRTCRLERCGNGVVDAVLVDGGFERCDPSPGDTVDGDGCSGDCRSLEVCGNGIVDDKATFDFPRGVFDGGPGDPSPVVDGGWRRTQENCDDDDFFKGGVPDGGDGCSAICQYEVCGNGYVDIDLLGDGGVREQCDDGNTNSTDESLGVKTFVDGDGGVTGVPGKFYRTTSGHRVYVALVDQDGSITGSGVSGQYYRALPTDPVTYELLSGPYYWQDKDDIVQLLDPAEITTNFPLPGCGPTCRWEVCGNGLLDTGEDCDDGNTTPNDGCDNNCTGTACGNGQLDVVYLTVELEDGGVADAGMDFARSEECDPGPLGDSATCNGFSAGDRKCRYQVCGDGYTNTALKPGQSVRVEQCDPGVNMQGKNSATCTSICTLSFCGDTFVNPVANEQCDPGQEPDGGGLDLFYCNGADGGTTRYGDGGTAACKVARCGDSYVNKEAGEQCDAPLSDAGVPVPLPADNCSATCQRANCGDGITDTAFGEVCDLGPGTNTSVCNQADAGFGVACQAPVCGDGYLNTQAQTASNGLLKEQCDDGNQVDTDGCLSTCLLPTCGDGFVRLGVETCDDGNTTSETVCPYGEVACVRCNATCTATLTEATLGLNVCGDGVQDLNKVKADGTTFSESCDDGNTDACGTCNNSCTGTNTLTASTGQIKVTYSGVTGNTVYDGVVLTIRDGIAAAPYVFEFDSNSSYTAGRTAITLAGGDTSAKKIGDKIVAAINGTAIAITASTATNASPSFITLTHDAAGIQGNQLIQVSGTTPPTDFGVTGMASGTGRDCPSNTGCFSNNDCLYGATCQTVDGSKICAGPPAAPEDVSTAVSTPGDPLSAQVRVSWTAVPLNQSGGAAVTSYTATASDGINALSCSAASPATTCTISGLTNGTTYSVTVTATNLYGTSVDSVSTTAIPRTVPGLPTISSAPSGTDRAITVTWTAPGSNGGNAITSYEATASDGSNTFFCTTSATPPATPALTCNITGLTNGTPYAVTVAATNAAGEGGASSPFNATPYGPPSAPLNVSVTSGQSAKLTATWQAPTDNGGATITRYDAYAKQGGVQRGTCFTTSTAPATPTLTCDITGLINGQSYDVTVVATNVQSKVGATSTAVTKVAATNPGAPTLNTVGNGTSLTLSPSWTASVNTGGPALTSFTAYAKQGGVEKGSCTTANGTTLTCDISPLVDGQTYDVTVIATNAEGYASVASNSIAKIPASGPSQPTLTQVTNGTTQTLTATWTAPSSTGGSAISAYTATARQAGVEKGSCTTANGSTLTCDIGGLVDGQSYDVTVTATNAAGLTSAASNSLSKMTGTQPGAPNLSDVTNGTTQRLVPSWTAPASTGGSSITSYTAYAKQGGTTIQSCTTANGSTLTCNINGLTDGQSYDVTVTATNQAGIEGLVSNSISKIPGTAPTAPSLTGVASGTSGRLTPSWTAPSSTGGSALTYTAYARQGASTLGQCTTAALTCAIDGLADGQSYTVTVMATNAGGIDGPESTSLTKVPGTTPSAPTNLSAPSGANGQVVLTWSAPVGTGGAAITTYDAVVKDGGNATAGTCSVDGTTFTCTIGSLANGTAYTVSLTATNAAGLTSAATGAVSFTPYTTPGAPSITGTTHGNAQVEVSWNAPANDGGATITGYTVSATATGQTTQSCSTTSVAPATPATTCTVTNLVNGVEYTFKVSATNAAGTGADSTGALATPSRLSDLPTISAATPGDTQVQLTWSVADDGGAPISDYVIEVSADSGANWTTVNDGTNTNTSYTVTGLTNGTEYAFRLAATNLNGTTSPSDPATATPRTVPGTPQNVTATSGFDKTTTVTWVVPSSDGGDVIQRYEATATAAGQQTRTCEALGAAAVTCDISNLANGVTYAVRVVAYNDAGGSAASDAVNATPDKVPPPPGKPTAIPGATAGGQLVADVSWTAPAGSDFSPVDYYEVEASLSATGTLTPPGRSGAAAAAVGTKAWIFGGHDGTAELRDMWEYDSATKQWSSLTLPDVLDTPTARTRSAMVTVGSNVYLFGGVQGGSYKNDLFVWGGTSWNIVTPTPDPVHGLPPARAAHALAAFNFDIVLFGGTDGTSDLSDTWTYDTGANTWTKKAPGTVPPARQLHALATYTQASVNKTLLFGGLVGGTGSDSMYEWDGTDWTLIPVALRPDARSEHALVSTGGSVLLFGGVLASNGTRTGSTSEWNGVSWSTAGGSGLLPARSLMAATDLGGAPFVFGGTTDTGELLRDTYDYTTTTAWRLLAESRKVLVAAGNTARFESLVSGSPYVFRARAHNARGMGAYSSLSEPLLTGTPKPPTVLTCQGNEDGKVPLTWDDATQDPGVNIVHYRIQFSSDNGVTWTDYTPDIAAPVSPMVGATYTVDDAPSTQLANGTTYKFRMAGMNGAGVGPYKEAASACTPDIKPAPPAAPTVVDLEDDRKIRVSWSAPSPICADASTACSPITSYRVSYRTAGGGAVLGTFTGTSPLDVTVASNGVSYEFLVEAANGVGVTNWSDPSAASSAVAATYSPSKPGTPTATLGNQAVTLSWSAPVTNNGAALTGYTVEQSDDDGATWSASTISGIADINAASISTDVTGLTNGTAYRFRVTAVNPVNAATPSKGQPSDQSLAVTPRTFPGTPGTPSGTPDNQSVVLTWTAPGSNGGAVLTDYLVQYSSDSGSTWLTARESGTAVTRTALVNPAAASLTTTLSGLVNGTAYVFRVTGVNAANANDLLVLESPVNAGVNGNPSASSVAVTPRTVPEAPSPVTTKVRGDSGATLAPLSGEVELSWTAPASGGNPITDYVIQYRVNGELNWTTFSDAVSTSTAVKVTGLTNGTLYDFRVAATNAAGTGAYTDPPVSATPRTVPSAPTGLAAKVLGEAGSTAAGGEVELTWQAPSSDGGNAITTYLIEYSTDNFANSTPVPTGGVPAGLTYKVTGLVNGTAYAFRIFARNAANPTELDPSNQRSTSVSATPRRLPDAPLSLSASAGSSSAQLSWSTDAPFNNGGSALTDFAIVYKKNGGAEQTYVDGVSTSNSTTVTGLEPGASYEFKVAAVSAAGTGTFTAFAAPVIPYTVPGKPLSVLVTNGTSGELTVNWSPPDSDGFNDITQYTATASTGNQFCTSSTTNCVITGLTNGTDQTVTVVATNAAGDGAASDPSTSTRVGTRPGAPTLNSVTNGTSQTLTANWTAGNVGSGGATTGYTATFVPTSGTTLVCTSAGTSCSVTNAVDGTEYTVTVKATNPAGDSADSGSLSKFAGTYPGAPTLNSVTNGTSQTLTANWTAGSVGSGGATTGFTATFALTPGTTTLTCTSAGTSCSVTTAENGESYTVSVTATNNAGTGAASNTESKVAGTYPGAPTAVTLTAGPGSPYTGPGSGKLAVSWTAPSAGFGFTAANLTYTAVVTNASTGAPVTTTGCSGVSTTTCTISGLTDGTGYTVKIQATNPAGTDNTTSVSTGVTETPFTSPGAPTNVYVSNITALNSQTVSWTAPASDGGKAITNYYLQRSADSVNFGTPTTVACTSAPCAITVANTQGAANYFRVCATNVLNTQSACGAWTKAFGGLPVSTDTVQNYRSGAPGTPRNVGVTVVGETTLTIGYTAPGYTRSTITGYTVQRATNEEFTEGTGSVSGNALSLQLTGLNPDTRYYIRVFATNSQGAGAYSNPISFVAGTPTAPTNVQAAGVTGNTVVGKLGVSWTASTSNNGGTVSYTVTAYTGTAPNLVAQGNPCTTTSTTCNVTGLVDGTQYTVKVVPTNTRGTGLEGSATLTPYSVPAAPTAVTMWRRDDTNANLSWTAPSVGPATQYRIEYFQTSSSSWLEEPVGSPTATVGTAAAPFISADWPQDSTNIRLRVIATNPAGQSSPGVAACSTANGGSCPGGSSGGLNL